jgi:nicotinamide-nucleotide amidase
MFDPKLIREVKDVLDRCRDGGLRLATVESCTGGLLAAALTAVPGSSAVVERGYVTYSNEAKTTMVGVPKALSRAPRPTLRSPSPASPARMAAARKSRSALFTSLPHGAAMLQCTAACCSASRVAIAYACLPSGRRWSW